MNLIKKIFRYLLTAIFTALIAVFLLIAALLAFTQTSWFKSILRDQVISILDDTLNAKVRFDKIEGSFFSSIILTDGQMSLGDTTIVSFESLELSYDLWSLLDSKADVKSIVLTRPYVYLYGDSSGALNFSRIVKPSEAPPKAAEPVDSLAPPLGGFQVHLGEFAIREGFVKIEMPGAHYTVKNLNIRMNADADSVWQKLELKQFAFTVLTEDLHPKTKKTVTDSLTCRNLTLSVSAHALAKAPAVQNRLSRPDTLFADIHHLRLTTDRTDVYLQAGVVIPDSLRNIPLSYSAELRTYPFHLDDVRLFSDIGLNDLKKIELETRLRGGDTAATVEHLSLMTSAGSIQGTAAAEFPPNGLRYKTSLKFNGLNAAAFTGQRDLSSVFNGSIEAKGDGTDISTMKSKVKFNLYRSRFQTIAIDQFDIEADVANGVAKLTAFKGRSSVGDFDCTGEYNLRTEDYRLTTQFRNINIANALGDTTLSSDINLNLTYTGRGFKPSSMSSQILIQADSSKIMGKRLDLLRISGRAEKGTVHLDQLIIRTPLAVIEAGGTAGMDSSVDMNYRIRTLDISLLKEFIGNDTLFRDTLDLDLDFKGRVRGNLNTLETDGQMKLTRFRFADMTIDSLQFNYFFGGIQSRDFQTMAFSDLDNHLYGDLYVYLNRADLGGSVMKDIAVSVTKESGKTNFEVSGTETGMDAYANAKGSVTLESESKGRLQLENLYLRVTGQNLKTKEISLRLGEDPIIDSTYTKWSEIWKNNQPVDILFNTKDNIYDIRSFSLDVGKGTVSLLGTLNITGDQSIDLKIKDLDLSRANALMGSGQSVIEGLLNMNASLKGSFEKPILIADWNISNGKAAEFVYDNFLGNMQYLNRKVQVNMTLNQNKDKTLTMGGYLPIDLTFKDVPERFTNRPMKFKIHSEGVDLRFLQSFFGKNLTLNRGEIKIDLEIGGSKDKPVVKGELKIEDGMVSFPRTTLGQNFRNARMFVRIKPDSIYLDTLSLQSGKDVGSSLFMHGFVNLSDLMKKFDFSNTDKIGYNFQLSFNNFIPINTKSETSYLHTAKITGIMDITANTLSRTAVKGDLQIRNAQIWVVDPARARSVSAIDETKTKKKIDLDQEKEASFYENLDLDLMVSLPENSDNTIRSADMLLSLFGEIGVTKPPGSEEFFISGDVNTKKGGKYTYLNAAFNIENGVIVFSGEPGINPSLNILAVKRFEYKDDDGNPIPSEARIQVTGTLMKPEIAITAVERGTDDPLPGLTEPIDILSYLALGVKTSQLNKLGADQAGDFAKQVAINQILNAVANKAGLQKLEYSAGSGGQGATIAVSKRISETLSVSYEGGLQGGSGKSVTLEIAADSLMKWMPGLKKWKKTIELEYITPDQENATQQEDILNFIFYFRKEY